MLRRALLLSILLTALVFLTAGSADAGRFGGAYRGPYQDRTTAAPEEDPDPQGAGSGDSAAPDAGTEGSGESGESGGASSGDGTGGTSGEGEGEGSPGEGEGEGEGSPGEGEGGSPSSPPTEGASGGGSAPSQPDPGGGTLTLPGSTPGGGGGGGGIPSGGGKGKVTQDDVFAFWPFWFEHNKEWVLADVLRARTQGLELSPACSAWYFSHRSHQERRVPITPALEKDEILPLLVSMSKSSHEWVRDSAVVAMGKLGGPDVVQHLVARSRSDSSPAVREDALLALGLTREKAALQPLLRALGRDKVRAWAALGVALLGREEALTEVLKQYQGQIRATDPEAAICLAVAIAELGEDRHADALAAPLGRRANSDLKVFVCHTLGRIGGDRARKALLKALGSRDGDVQGAAVLALSRWNDGTVINQLRGRHGMKSGKKMPKLFSIVSLARIARGLEFRDTKRKLIQADLREIAEKPLQDKYTAMYASLGLGITDDSGSMRFFSEVLDKEFSRKYSAENRSAIALSCGLLRSRTVARDLRDVLRKTSYEPDYRGYAAFALGIMGEKSARGLIRELLSVPRQKHEVLRSGCWGLGLLGGPSDADVLMKVLSLDSKAYHQARGAAALALGMVGDAGTAEKLIKLVRESQDPTTRAFGIASLGCLVDDAPVPRIAELFANTHYRVVIDVVREALSIL